MRYITAIISLLCIVSATFETQARKQSTTRSGVNGRSATVETKTALPVDSFIIPDSTDVLLFGYDKPLRSRRETVFISNNTERDITAVAITTQYLDSKGRQFHKSHQRVVVDIPAGETRKVDYPSWDKQQSFYYVGSQRPRVSASPYSVAQSVDTIFVDIR